MSHPPRACLLGHRVGYSRSPLMHRHWLEVLGIAGSYELKDVAPASFPDFLRKLQAHGFVGANITKPYKLAALTLVDCPDAAASAIGAVNTVFYESGRLVGSNTDAHGFLANLDHQAPGWDGAGGLALVIGAGGAARAVVYALRSRGLQVAICNRTRARAEALAAQFAGSAHDFAELPRLLKRATLLTNASLLGAVGEPPLELDLAPLAPGAVVCDIVYVPLITELLRSAAAAAHRTADGLGMLMHQAVPAFARFFGRTPQVTAQLRALLSADIADGGAR